MSIQIITGDSREQVPQLAENSIDACVTDPPYALVQGSRNGSAQPGDIATPYGRSGPSKLRGFMGKEWDTGETAFDPAFWVEVRRVLKPGGHLVAFGGTRTYHRLVCAIEDAGFEIRDQLAWLFGSGFPKSHNQHGEWEGWGTALKPAHEPICLARKPLVGTVAANLAQHRTGALNISASRIATDESLNGGAYQDEPSSRHDGTESWRFRNGGRKPLHGDERTGAALGMYQAGKTTGLEFKQPTGRWPANVIHDGSPEVLAGFPESKDGVAVQRNGGGQKIGTNVYQGSQGGFAREDVGYGGGGSAARFFYTPKADKADRCLSKHPTVKPIDLMAYLIKLVTPPGGIVLDPFAGSGSTGMAAMREGFNAILIEREAEYVADIQRRLDHVHGNDTPLFAGAVA